jgi:hypothetical protein
MLCLGGVLLAGCSPTKTESLLQPSQALGTVLAKEVARLAGANKKVAVITTDPTWGPTSTAEQTFRTELNKQGFQIATAKSVNVGNAMRRGPIGLKAEDFWEALGKSTDAAAIVSFAGSPLVKVSEAARLSSNHPRVLVVATASLGNVAGVWSDPVQLAGLMEAGIIDLAVIDSPEPGPEPSKADAGETLFTRHFRILRPN